MFVNPPRLSDFKQVLTKAGVQVHGMGCVRVWTKLLMQYWDCKEIG